MTAAPRLAYVECRHCGRRTLTANPGLPPTCSNCLRTSQRDMRARYKQRRAAFDYSRDMNVTQATHMRRGP